MTGACAIARGHIITQEASVSPIVPSEGVSPEAQICKVCHPPTSPPWGPQSHNPLLGNCRDLCEPQDTSKFGVIIYWGQGCTVESTVTCRKDLSLPSNTSDLINFDWNPQITMEWIRQKLISLRTHGIKPSSHLSVILHEAGPDLSPSRVSLCIVTM